MMRFLDEQARQNYIDMKRAAGVEPGHEFIKIVNGKLVPCSEEEYDKAKNYWKEAWNLESWFFKRGQSEVE